jgi:hypothetical protein
MKKNINRLTGIFVIILILITTIQCTKEPPASVNPNFSITVNDTIRTYANVGDLVTFTNANASTGVGSGVLFSYYPGDSGAVYSSTNPTIKGKVATNGILTHTYAYAGTFQITCVVSSYGNWSSQSNRATLTKSLIIYDKRNALLTFSMTPYKYVSCPGTFNFQQDTINVLIPNTISLVHIASFFTTSSTAATVWVHGKQILSGDTTVHFSSPVDTATYVVKSLYGNSKSYLVNINTFPASNLDAIDSIYLTNPKILGHISNDTAYLSLPFGFNNKKVLMEINISPFATIPASTGFLPYGADYANQVPSAQNFTNPIKKVVVTAQNGVSTQTWYIDAVVNQPFTSFICPDLIPVVNGFINNVTDTITLGVLPGTDLNQLVVSYAGLNYSAYTLVANLTDTLYQSTISGSNIVVNPKYTFVPGTTAVNLSSGNSLTFYVTGLTTGTKKTYTVISQIL